LLSGVPDAGKIQVVRDGVEIDRRAVMETWRRTLFLRDASPVSKGWMIEVLRTVEAMGRTEFTLDEMYGREARLAALYPGNNNVRPKIRQQLQVLRDNGLIEFLGKGRYRRIGLG
jgi:type II restriction enzyme